MLREIVEGVNEGEKEDIDSVYKEITNPYDSIEKKVGGVAYSKLEDVNVEAGVTFYAKNENGKFHSMKVKVGLRAKKAVIGGVDYIVTDRLKYPGKKWIKELMFAKA